MPQVSVIIPTYNRARYVSMALESVISQSFQDYEIIVVDDGSSDGTRAALEPYRDRIRYLYQENAGVSAARNAGIRAATGSWIAYLDSDDEWRPGYLAAQMESAQLFPQAVAHITDSASVSLSGARNDHFEETGVVKLFGRKDRIVVERPFRVIVGHSHWFLQPVVMRRDTLMKSGLFDPALSIAEDMDVVARLALRGAFTFSRQALVDIYRREEDTAPLSGQYLNRGIYSRKAFAKVFSDLFPLPELTPLDRVVLCRTLGQTWRSLGNIYLESGNVAQARRCFMESLRVYPGPKALAKCLAAFLPCGVARMVVRKKVKVVAGDEVEIP